MSQKETNNLEGFYQVDSFVDTLWATFDRMKNITLAPVNFSLEILEQTGKRYEQSSQEFLKFQRERKDVWVEIADQYLELTKNNQRVFLHTLEDSFRTLTGVAK